MNPIGRNRKSGVEFDYPERAPGWDGRVGKSSGQGRMAYPRTGKAGQGIRGRIFHLEVLLGFCNYILITV